ncbi:MAG TPA: hypothetical protein VGK20_07210 [Candidatus Binatia bacterium]|jgi:hypothetical protein
MTAVEILRSAVPPGDDAVIEKAIADLDAKLWEWTDALKSAQDQLRSAFATRPLPQAPPAPRPSSNLYDEAPMPSLAASAAAAHIPSAPPLPDWSSVQSSVDTSWTPPSASRPQPSAPGAPPPPSSFQNLPSSNEWPQQPPQAAYHGAHGAGHGGPQPNAGQPPPGFPQGGPQQNTATGGMMQWPTTPTGNWPESAQGTGTQPQAWPTWNPNDGSQPRKGGVRASKAPKAVRPIVQGPTPEERAQKAAAEEALLSELEEAIARRVRLLRRLDPDTAIERLIDKARQGHAEAQAAAPSKEDSKTTSSSSWWRRK